MKMKLYQQLKACACALLTMGASLTTLTTQAQYATTAPTIDGTLDAVYVSSGNWSMCWDETFLYIRKNGGQPTEPAILYLDINPLEVVSGGTDANGSIAGRTHWLITPTLPFRADFNLYWESGYAGYRLANGSNGWGGETSVPTTGTGSVRSNTGTSIREIRIAWTDMGLTGRPASFNWLGYANSTPLAPLVGSMYDEFPTENPDGVLSTPTFNWYGTVPATANGSASNPFSQVSFETRAGSGAFGWTPDLPATIYDLTINATAATYTLLVQRDFEIRNRLVVGSNALVRPENYASANFHTITFSGTSSNAGIVNNGTIFGTWNTAAQRLNFIISGTVSLGGTSNTEVFNCTVNNGATLNVNDRTLRIWANGSANGTLTVNGVMTAGVSGLVTRIATGASATINGTFRTQNVNGLQGASSTFPDFNPTLGTSSIVDYNRNGDQTVNPITYRNLTISGSSGTKTMGAGAATVLGALTLNRDLVLHSAGSSSLTLSSSVAGSGTLTGNSSANLTVSASGVTLNFTQTSAATRTLSNLTVSGTGSVTLGNALEVVGNVSLTSSATPALTTGGNLTLKSTAANVHATITGGTNASLSGNANIERFVPAHSGAGGYSFFGHPLRVNPSFTDVTGLGASTTGTVFYDETRKTVTGTSPNQVANAWRGISATSAAIEQGRGYGQWTTTAKNLVFTGAPQLSDFNFNLSFTPGTYSLNMSTIDPGYNLCANPFPAEYPFSDISRINAEATMYVWDKNNGPSGGYRNTGSLTRLAPGQAFFVRATTTGASVTFAAASRAASGTASMYRTAANSFVLSYGQNWTDEMSVTFRDDATIGFDTELDGRNLMGGPLNNEIYTILDGTEYVLNNLPVAARSRSLALGIRVGTPGRMSLSYASQEGEVILEDRLTGALHNFERGAYTFTAEAGKHDSRFVLHFNARQISSQTASALEESFYAFDAENAVGVAFRQAGHSGEVTVLDITGRAVAAPVQVTGSETIRIAVSQAAGVYLVRLRTAEGTAVKRVVVE